MPIFRRALIALSVLLVALAVPVVAHAAPYKNLLSIDAAALPAAPSAVTAAANAAGTLNLSNQDDAGDTNAFAAGLVYAKTGDSAYKSKVCATMSAAQGTEAGARALALGRNVQGLAYAWDLVGGPNSGCANAASLQAWLVGLRDAPTTSGPTSVKDCHNDRPNNWGTHCGAARIALDVLSGDTTDLAAAANVFHGYVGDRASYAGFSYGELSWQASESAPVGVNPVGAVKFGHDVDGVIPDDARRCGTLTTGAMCFSNYVREAHQGGIAQALMLKGAGFDALAWGSSAMKRVMDFVYRTTFADGRHVYDGDDAWVPCVVNKLYGSSYSGCDNSVGKGLGYAAYWAPAVTLGGSPPPPPPPAACADGVDNDLDGLIDYPADPGCASASDTDEANAPPADTTAPSAVSNLRSTATSTSSFDVAWTAATDNVGVDHYEVEVTKVSDPLFTWDVYSLAGSVTQDSVSALGAHPVEPGTAYDYALHAIDAAGNSGAWSTVRVTTATSAPPAANETLVASGDAYVDAGAPTANNGAAVSLWVDGDPVRETLFKFPQPASSQAPATATLRFFQTTAQTGTYDVYAVSAAGWTETGVTYNNRPARGSLVASGKAAVAGWNSVTVPVSLVSATGASSFVIVRTATSRIDIASRETTSDPELVLTY